MKETDLQKQCLHYLNLQGKIFAWRNNTTGVWDAKKGIYRRNPGQLKGVSDILGVTDTGRMVAFEVKLRSGKIRPEQDHFINKVNAMGGLAVVIYSLEELVEVVRQLRTH